jgi:hypothetical protein
MKTGKTLFLRPMHKKHVQAPTDMRKNSYPQNTMNRHFNNLLGNRHGATGLWALLLVVCTLAFALAAQAADTFRAVSKSLDTAAESSQPGNGVIDPGETNTVTFTFKNTSGAERKNVKVQMRSETGNVGFSLTGEQTIGTVAKDATFTATFRFRTDGPAGGTLSPRFYFKGDGVTDGTDIDSTDADKFDFFLGKVVATTYTFPTQGPSPSTILHQILIWTKTTAGQARIRPK